MKTINKQYLTIILIIVVGVTAFFGGMQYQKTKLSQNRFADMQNGRNNQFFRNRNGAKPVNGEIVSQDDKSITVKLGDSSSKIVILTKGTIINKTSQANVSDLKTGEKVVVFGNENSDGSITALNMQLNPQLRGFMATPSASAK